VTGYFVDPEKLSMIDEEFIYHSERVKESKKQ
jgi:hypothetical protein